MKIIIIGSGAMASGISQVCVQANFIEQVIIVGRSAIKLENLNSLLVKGLTKLKKRGKLSSECFEAALAKISLSIEYNVIEGADLVIEAVSEDYSIKRSVLSKVSPYVSSKTVVATNTSSLSITDLSNELAYPEMFIGLHFFNPAPLMELIEIVIGLQTSIDTKEFAAKFATDIHKVPVIVNEAPGFIVNRMLIPMINEAIGILSEGVATKEDIDKAMKCGSHHPMGPLELADLIGNDVTLSIMDTLHKEMGDSKYRAHPLLRKMVRAGYLGRKSKKGFYPY
jgi:3-hydroxybutyryl-CoA dehydrogenase